MAVVSPEGHFRRNPATVSVLNLNTHTRRRPQWVYSARRTRRHSPKWSYRHALAVVDHAHSLPLWGLEISRNAVGEILTG